MQDRKIDDRIFETIQWIAIVVPRLLQELSNPSKTQKFNSKNSLVYHVVFRRAAKRVQGGPELQYRTSRSHTRKLTHFSHDGPRHLSISRISRIIRPRFPEPLSNKGVYITRVVRMFPRPHLASNFQCNHKRCANQRAPQYTTVDRLVFWEAGRRSDSRGGRPVSDVALGRRILGTQGRPPQIACIESAFSGNPGEARGRDAGNPRGMKATIAPQNDEM